MKQKFSPWKNILFVVGVLIITILFVTICNAGTITFKNCTPGTWVGGVRWVWKDGIRGNYEGSDYIVIPELKLKNVGSISVNLPPGDYAITYFQPSTSIVTLDGRLITMPSKILDFREITVTDESKTYYFGCE